MGNGEIVVLSIFLVFGSIYFIFKNYDSKNDLKRSLAWILGALLALIMFLSMPNRY